MQRGTWIPLLFAALLAVGCGGCDSKPAPAPAPKVDADGGHEHEDHGHSHAAKGPHTGQVLAIGAEEYHAEFTHDDGSGKVTVYLLDKDIKVNPEASSAEEIISIDVKTKDETKKYDLAAVGAVDGKASQFEVVDKELLGFLETLGGDVAATLNVKIGDKQFNQPINFDDHGHAH
jgi:hypothetical protein